MSLYPFFSSFFFNDTATTEIYTLSLHDALPISLTSEIGHSAIGKEEDSKLVVFLNETESMGIKVLPPDVQSRSEEHTSELQSQSNLVCRLLLEKKKKKIKYLQQLNITLKKHCML